MAKQKEVKGSIEQASTALQKDTIPPKAQPKVIVKRPKQTYTLADAKKPKNRKKRKPVTMMLRPDLKELLNNIADNNNKSMSAVIEEILKEYFGID